ncbi:hypothetical protein F2Q70_00040651 [Brassica cretica]|uniref:Uncharacterized protein n=1 Tax=Brassica cretica TaxID=69181 RepID=A0A8S9K7A9_BRACR|nr:hypothetical protein F2Q70_00040651 [Brassica cretica]
MNLKRPESASMAENNDLVNHIEGVFRYFIVDVVDPGSCQDVAGFSKVIQGCKNLLLCEKGFRLLTSRDSGRLLAQKERVQGVFALVFYGIVRRFSEGFHDVLGFNLPGISVASGVLIYCEGCCRRVEVNRLMRVRLCVIMRVYSWIEVQRTRSYKAAIFRGNAVWFSNQIWHMRGNKWVYMVSRLQTVLEIDLSRLGWRISQDLAAAQVGCRVATMRRNKCDYVLGQLKSVSLGALEARFSDCEKKAKRVTNSVWLKQVVPPRRSS